MFHFVNAKGEPVPTVIIHNAVAQDAPDEFPLMCAHAIIAMGHTRGCLKAYNLACYLDLNPDLEYLRESFLDNFAGFYTFWFVG